MGEGRTRILLTGIAASLILPVASRAAEPPHPPPPSFPSPYFRFHDAERRLPDFPNEDLLPSKPQVIEVAWFGPADPDGELWRGASLAMEEINAAGGVKGIPLRLTPVWSEDPWGSGAAALARLLYRKPVWAVVGSVDGPATHLLAQVAAKARVPVVSPLAGDVSINLAGVPWVFSCAPADDCIGAAMAAAATSMIQEHPGQVVVLSATDHDSRLLTDQVLRRLRDHRENPAFHFEFNPAEGPFPALEARLREADCSLVVMVAGDNTIAGAMNWLAEVLPHAGIVASPDVRRSACRHEISQANRIAFPLLFDAHANAESAEFAGRFESRYGAAPDYAAALGYDAVGVIAAGLTRSNLQRHRLAMALRQISPYSGVCGPIQWNSLGQNTRTNLPITGLIPPTAQARTADSGSLWSGPLPKAESQ